MVEHFIAIVLDESKWLATAMLLSILAVAVQAGRRFRRGPSRNSWSSRVRWQSALLLFYGCMIGIMGSGHLLAVTVKVFQRTLEGSVWLLYPLGLALAVPAWWLAACAGRLQQDEERVGRRAVALNAWLGVSLLAFGPHNGPLALPAALNIAYHYHSRRAVGWTLVTVSGAAYLALFIGSLIFLASGQSFEQFQGME